MRHKVGLVLSGGGVSALAHVGLIKFLEEQKIEVTHVSATSSGAIIGALYAAGYDADEINSFLKKTSLFRGMMRAYPTLIDVEESGKIIRRYIRKDHFSSLSKKLYLSTTNLNTASNQIFHEGQLIQPLLASMANPMVFKPVKIGTAHFLDGSITNYFPIEPLRWQCDYVIGSYVMPISNIPEGDLAKSKGLLKRTYEICSHTNAVSKLSLCDLLVQPKSLQRFHRNDLKFMDEIDRMGYVAAEEEFRQLQEVPRPLLSEEPSIDIAHLLESIVED